MTENEIKTNFARNLRELRIDRNLNQIQLGEKIHYSSKAISKWENEDVLPDVVTLNMLAEFFDITVDDLISSKNAVRRSHRKQNRILVTASSCILPFFIAAIVFLILQLCGVNNSWKGFVVALPASAIVLIVFSALWFKRYILNIAVVVLIWGAILVAMVFMNFEYYWIMLIVAAILTLMSIVFFNIRFPSKENKTSK